MNTENMFKTAVAKERKVQRVPRIYALFVFLVTCFSVDGLS